MSRYTAPNHALSSQSTVIPEVQLWMVQLDALVQEAIGYEQGRFQPKYEHFYQQRADIVMGVYEPTDRDCNWEAVLPESMRPKGKQKKASNAQTLAEEILWRFNEAKKEIDKRMDDEAEKSLQSGGEDEKGTEDKKADESQTTKSLQSRGKDEKGTEDKKEDESQTSKSLQSRGKDKKGKEDKKEDESQTSKNLQSRGKDKKGKEDESQTSKSLQSRGKDKKGKEDKKEDESQTLATKNIQSGGKDKKGKEHKKEDESQTLEADSFRRGSEDKQGNKDESQNLERSDDEDEKRTEAKKEDEPKALNEESTRPGSKGKEEFQDAKDGEDQAIALEGKEDKNNFKDKDMDKDKEGDNLEEKKAQIASNICSTRGIPDFWLTVFKNVQILDNMVEVHDEPILSHLVDLRLVYNMDHKDKETKGFTILFYFSPNNYFTNLILTKDYEMVYELDPRDPFFFDKPAIVGCRGCHICWNEGRNVTERAIKKRKKGGQRGTVTKTLKLDSFFNFFSPPHASDDPDTLEIFNNDFRVGHTLREKVIPNAFLYFTGELSDDSSDDEEYDEEDSEDDDEDDSWDDLFNMDRENPADCSEN